jgi:hypothetical protein
MFHAIHHPWSLGSCLIGAPVRRYRLQRRSCLRNTSTVIRTNNQLVCFLRINEKFEGTVAKSEVLHQRTLNNSNSIRSFHQVQHNDTFSLILRHEIPYFSPVINFVMHETTAAPTIA